MKIRMLLFRVLSDKKIQWNTNEGRTMQILIVEDDAALSQALSHILKENGYTVETAHDGVTGLSYALTGAYDVVVLDVMLPAMNGLEVVSRMRHASVNTPVLLLTALNTVSNKIKGLDSGADDYMTKPFAPSELLAHLRALGRRQGEVVYERITAGDLVLDLESHELSSGAKTINLSNKEFMLARLFMANAGHVLSKSQIIYKVWGVDSATSENNVEVYISFLRKKLSYLESQSRIESLRSAGYRLIAAQTNADDSAAEAPNESSNSQHTTADGTSDA